MRSFECQRRADLLNNLRALIRRCRIKTVFNTLRDKGIELRVRHTLHNYWGDGGLGLLRHQRCNHAHELDRIKHGHCLERWLAESLPYITEILKKLLAQLVARALRPALRIAGFATLSG